MFSLERGLRYWLYSEPTDMRKSFHALSGVVRNRIGGDPMNGDVYIFVNKRRNRIKLLHYERGGMLIPESKDVVTSSIMWEDLRKMVEGIMADLNSRQARLNELKSIWKK